MVCFHVPMQHQREAPELMGFGQKYVRLCEGPLSACSASEAVACMVPESAQGEDIASEASRIGQRRSPLPQ